MIPVNEWVGNHERLLWFVNDNLAAMLGVFTDMLGDADDVDSYLKEILPRDYVARYGPSECINRIAELRELIESPVTRISLKPLYQYMLYCLIVWWRDSFTDQEELFPPVKLDESLRFLLHEEIIAAGYDPSYTSEFDLIEYSCFQDHDFQPDSLAGLVTLLLLNPEEYNSRFSDVDLDEYVDLMEPDVREQYRSFMEAVRGRDAASRRNSTTLREKIIEVCKVMQSTDLYRQAQENPRNTFMTQLLDMAGYSTKDQTLLGSSPSGKRPGEIDILVRYASESLAIVECFRLNSLKKDVVDRHLSKMFRYDSTGFLDNYIIIYAEAKRFDDLWRKYIKHISKPAPFICFQQEQEQFANLRTGKSIHLRNGIHVNLHHIMINFSGP